MYSERERERVRGREREWEGERERESFKNEVMVIDEESDSWNSDKIEKENFSKKR